MKTLKSMLAVVAIVLLTGIPGSFIIAGFAWLFTSVLFGLEEPAFLETWGLLYTGLVVGVVVAELVRWAITAATASIYARKIGVPFQEVAEAMRLGFKRRPSWSECDKEEFLRWLKKARFVAEYDARLEVMER